MSWHSLLLLNISALLSGTLGDKFNIMEPLVLSRNAGRITLDVNAWRSNRSTEKRMAVESNPDLGSDENNPHEQALEYLTDWANKVMSTKDYTVPNKQTVNRTKTFRKKPLQITSEPQYFPQWFQNITGSSNRKIGGSTTEPINTNLLDWSESSDEDPDHFGPLPSDWQIPRSLMTEIDKEIMGRDDGAEF